MSFHLVNPNDKSWTKSRYVIALGAYGWTRLLVWANSLDDALDESIDWACDNAKGLLCDNEVNEAYDLAIAEGHTEESAWEIATVDTTSGGNAGNRINSDHWHLLCENPDRATLKAIIAESERL
jgi:hypothetical protein